MERLGHVLITTDAMGTIWDYSLSLANALAEDEVTVSLAVLGTPSRDQRTKAGSINRLSIYESSLDSTSGSDPCEGMDEAAEWILNLDRELEPDVLHLNEFCFGSLLTVTPKVVVCHSCEAVQEDTAYRRALRRGLCGADIVVAPTEHLLNELRSVYGFTGEGAVVAAGKDMGRKYMEIYGRLAIQTATMNGVFVA